MKKTLKIAQTAMLLAMALVFQSLRYIPTATMSPIVGVLIIGSLVNLVLFVAAAKVGLWSSVLIAVVTPLVAVLESHLPHIFLAPAVAIGNAIIAVTWWLFHDKLKLASHFVTMIFASILKFLFLWWAVPFTFRMFLYDTWEGGNADAVLANLAKTMSLPQLITAVIGGTLAVIIIRVLPKNGG